MGTRAIIRVVQDDRVYVTIYRQFDGYPTGAGKEILDAIGRRKIVNGMSGQQASSIANGAGCPDPCTWVVVRRGGTYAVVRCVRCGTLQTVTRSVAARMTGGNDAEAKRSMEGRDNG